MDKACNTHGSELHTKFLWDILKEGDHREALDIAGGL
jgi:hypothetical protein